MLDNTMNINDTMTPFKRDVRAKEVVSFDENILSFEKILGPIDIAQPIFDANGIIQRIIMSAD